MMEEYLTMISSVGFPIVMCGWFMYRMEKVIKNNTEALNKNAEQIMVCKFKQSNVRG